MFGTDIFYVTDFKDVMLFILNKKNNYGGVLMMKSQSEAAL